MVKQKLQQRGVEVDVIAMEHKGIPKYLDSLDLCFENLEIKPACIYYRRRDIDMPLAEVPYGCSEEKLRKVQNVRKKIIANAHKKYLFDVRPLCLTKEVHSQAGSVCGITFHCMNYDGKELTKSTREIYVDTKLIISSIGSIPEPLDEIPMERETYAISDTITGAVNDYHGIYGVGNAVTGKGNIMVSNRHAKSMSSFVASAITRTPREEMVKVWEKQNRQVQAKMREIYEYLLGIDGLQEEELQTIDDKINGLQQQVDYHDYMDWKERVLAGRC